MTALDLDVRVVVLDRLNWALQQSVAKKASASNVDVVGSVARAKEQRWKTRGYYGWPDQAFEAAMKKDLAPRVAADGSPSGAVQIVAGVQAARADVGAVCRVGLSAVAVAMTGTPQVTPDVRRRVDRILKASGGIALPFDVRLVVIDQRSMALQRRNVTRGTSPRWRAEGVVPGKEQWKTLGYYGLLEHAADSAVNKCLIERFLPATAVDGGELLTAIGELRVELAETFRSALAEVAQAVTDTPTFEEAIEDQPDDGDEDGEREADDADPGATGAEAAE